MRIRSIATGAFALMLSFISPTAAGEVCDDLDLDSPCIRSNDIRPSLTLGGSHGNARLQLRDAAGEQGVELRATTGNVTNLFSNDEDQSNGLVKAWAQINFDGTIAACWRCNTDPDDTRRVSQGIYQVDFTPLSTDIRGRPRSAILNARHIPDLPLAILRVTDNENGDFSAATVYANDLTLTDNILIDTPFVLIIY